MSRFQKSTALHPRRDRIDVEILMTKKDVFNEVMKRGYRIRSCYNFAKLLGFPVAPTSVAAVENWVTYHQEQVRQHLLANEDHLKLYRRKITDSAKARLAYDLVTKELKAYREVSKILNIKVKQVDNLLYLYRHALKKAAVETNGTR